MVLTFRSFPCQFSMLFPASRAWCRQVRRIWKVSVEDGRGTSRKELGSLNHCPGENYLLTRVSFWTFFFLNVWAIHRFGVTIIIYQSLTETDIRSRRPYFPAPHAECSQVTKFWPMRCKLNEWLLYDFAGDCLKEADFNGKGNILSSFCCCLELIHNGRNSTGHLVTLQTEVIHQENGSERLDSWWTWSCSASCGPQPLTTLSC